MVLDNHIGRWCCYSNNCFDMKQQRLIVLSNKKPPDFNSPKVKRELKNVQQEINNVLKAAEVDTSKLHIVFR